MSGSNGEGSLLDLAPARKVREFEVEANGEKRTVRLRVPLGAEAAEYASDSAKNTRAQLEHYYLMEKLGVMAKAKKPDPDNDGEFVETLEPVEDAISALSDEEFAQFDASTQAAAKRADSFTAKWFRRLVMDTGAQDVSDDRLAALVDATGGASSPLRTELVGLMDVDKTGAAVKEFAEVPFM